MKVAVVCAGLLLAAGAVIAQSTPSADSLVAGIIAVDKQQRDQIKDIVILSDYVRGEENDRGEFVERGRFAKRVSLKYLPGRVLIHEDYLQYWKDGKPQSDKDCRKAAAEDREKRRRRATPNITYPILNPFWPSHRELYNIEYRGIAGEQVDNYLCYHFSVAAKEPADTLLNGDYFFDTESLHLVRVTYAPSKLVDRMMFKMSEMQMALDFRPNESGVWLPAEFNLRMKAKAMWVINVPAVVREVYSQPIVNGGVSDTLFGVDNGK